MDSSQCQTSAVSPAEPGDFLFLVKANASKHKALSHGHIEKLEAHPCEEVQIDQQEMRIPNRLLNFVAPPLRLTVISVTMDSSECQTSAVSPAEPGDFLFLVKTNQNDKPVCNTGPRQIHF